MDFPIGMVAPHQDFSPQCVDHHACVNPPGSIDLQMPLGERGNQDLQDGAPFR